MRRWRPTANRTTFLTTKSTRAAATTVTAATMGATTNGNGGLTLGRRAQESVIIRCGDTTIEVVMVEIRGDKARLYFSAPRHVVLLRAELEERPGHDD